MSSVNFKFQYTDKRILRKRVILWLAFFMGLVALVFDVGSEISSELMYVGLFNVVMTILLLILFTCSMYSVFSYYSSAFSLTLSDQILSQRSAQFNNVDIDINNIVHLKWVISKDSAKKSKYYLVAKNGEHFHLPLEHFNLCTNTFVAELKRANPNIILCTTSEVGY